MSRRHKHDCCEKDYCCEKNYCCDYGYNQYQSPGLFGFLNFGGCSPFGGYGGYGCGTGFGSGLWIWIIIILGLAFFWSGRGKCNF